MKPVLNIGNSVCVNGKLGTVVYQLGKETKDPSEEKWFEVEFNENIPSDHFPEFKITPDLFEHPECIPQEVKEVLDRFADKVEEGMSYEDCASLVSNLEAVGYTCEYYLQAEPFFLRKKEITLAD